MGGCITITTNTTVFPRGSRCALQPCQNGGFCFDLSSTDVYHCRCSSPLTGVNCELQKRQCRKFVCGKRTSEFLAMCINYTSDKALPYFCECRVENSTVNPYLAFNKCHHEKLFTKPCDEGKPLVGVVLFTNKACYICIYCGLNVLVESCDL